MRMWRPSLGGYIAMGNCLLVSVLIMAGYHIDCESPLVLPIAIAIRVATLPFAYPFVFMPIMHEEMLDQKLLFGIFYGIPIGLNAFFWGYGFEYLLILRSLAKHPERYLPPD